MTQGNIARSLVMFAIPLLLGNLLQQFYNAVDSSVVGNYVSYEALAAVGSTGPLVNMVIALAQGLAQGAGVMIARHYGSGDSRALSGTLHTSLLLSVFVGAFLSAIGIVFCPVLLRFMGTPENIMDGATLYLRIVFSGFVFTSLYNTGAAILTAVGDSRRPLYFLAVSALLNVAGDLLLVRVFDMGVAGVAVATVFAQIVSVLMVCFVLLRTDEAYKLSLREIKIETLYVRAISGIGLPTAIQNSIVGLSNVMVQSYYNGLGAVAVAGFAASSKIDAFAHLPVMTMSMAISTFVAQNLGADKAKRARDGVKYAMAIGAGATLILAVVAFFSARQLLWLFTNEEEVLQDGMIFIHTMAPFYVALTCTQILPGALRGAGDVTFSTVASVVSFVVLRQIYLAVITRIKAGAFYTLLNVTLCYPVTWSICALSILIYYSRKKIY